MQLERAAEDEHRATMLAALQQKVEELAASLRGQAPACPGCGGAMKLHDTRGVSWVTRFGKVRGRAERWRCKPCRRERRPLIEALGVEPGRISGALARLLALLGTVVPYELAATLAYLCFGVRVSPMGVWRVVQRLGEACEQHLEGTARYHADGRSELPSPAAHAPAVIVAGVDGCALGMQVRARRRRRKAVDEVLPPLPAVEDGHFREVKTGVLLLPAERFEPSPGRHSVVRRVLVTCLGDADAIFSRLWSRVVQLGWLGANTVVVIVGDGAEWIWKRAAMFERRCEILDFWHAVEKAWEFARLAYGEQSTAAARFVARLAKDLRAGKVQQVVKRLSALQAATPEVREKLDALRRYYTDNASRMRYDEYLRLGYGIGSGAVESSHKQVVHARLRQAGMRWSERGARRLLALRVTLLNGEWEQLDRMRMVTLAA
jgi:hypothetical protein